MSRRTYTNRSMAAAKLCVALVGMAAIPTWALAQQSTAKPESTKAANAEPLLKLNLGNPVSPEKTAGERELEALKAEMEALNARLKQLQANKTKQKAVQAEVQIQDAKKAELKALEALKARNFALADLQKEGVKVEGLKLQLGELKVQAQQAIEKEKVAADTAANVAKTLKDLKLAQIAPAAQAPVKSETRQILRSGSQGVKVIGADGKEIPGVVVIIDTQMELAAPPAKATTTIMPGVNGGVKGTLLLKTEPAQATAPAQTPKVVEGKPLTAETLKAIQVAPAAPANPAPPVKVEGIRIMTQPGATPPVPPSHLLPLAPHSHLLPPAKVEGVRILMQPGATAPAVPPLPAKPKSDITWTFEAVNMFAPAANTITLSRATYKLPKEQAATLATLLGGLKHVVMETKVDNDTLVVTTTPEAQKEIAGFVKLITGAMMKVNFSSVQQSAATPALPALPTTQAAPAISATGVFEFNANDAKDFYAVVSDEDLKAKVQQFQIHQGKNGEMTIVGTTEKPKADTKKIEIKAIEKNGNLNVETFDVVGDKPSALQIKKGEKGETIIVGVVDTPKTDVKKINVNATEKNGVVTVETVDVGDSTPKMLRIIKGENGETIVIDATEGQAEKKATIRVKNLTTVVPAGPTEAP